MESILIAEDESPIREGLIDLFEGEGYPIRAAKNGVEALQMYHRERPDLILLDVMMPEKSGYDVAREIRKKDSKTLILMLTAKGQELDKVVGLELGADDYIVKPFSVGELLARVRSHLRRLCANTDNKSQIDSGDSFLFGPWEVIPRTMQLVGKNRSIHNSFELSSREIALLRLFADREGDVLERNFILNEVWGFDYMGTTRTLDQHIAKLRKKIESLEGSCLLIKTIHGVGYQYLGSSK